MAAERMVSGAASAREIARASLAPHGLLRSVINLDNFVLGRSLTRPDELAGLTIDLTHELARRLGVRGEARGYATASLGAAAMAGGEAELGFMAIDPVREDLVRFSRPYVILEGCYLVRPDSPLATTSGSDLVDRPDIEVVAGVGSAYLMYLRRHLDQVRFIEVVGSGRVVEEVFRSPLRVGSGLRQQLEHDAAAHPGARLLEPAFMTIDQAVAIQRGCPPQAVAWLDELLAELAATGWLTERLAAHGFRSVRIPGAPPGPASR